ncbi:MAG TPA: DUF2254 family protein [Polyangiaceae bacterium]|nr:DUF2254 family protein [Polyangiaceae bacterium]
MSVEPNPRIVRAANRSWLYPLAIFIGVSMASFFAVHMLDLARAKEAKLSFWDVFMNLSAEDAGHVMGGAGEVIAAILGIVITVASIIVQLAATRYTARITKMFFRDRTNVLVMAFFVVSAVVSLWVNFSIRQGSKGSTAVPFVPYYGILITMIFLTLSLVIMVPYFAYVFDFLEPDKIVARIKSIGVGQALSPPSGEPDEAVDKRRMAALGSLEQLADIALNAIQQKDKGLASSSIDSISELVVAYVLKKPGLDERWFQIRGELLADADFVSMNAESLETIAENKTWLEYKALRQFLLVYREALAEIPDIVNRVAIDTRYIGLAAISAGDRKALDVAVKFFNTFMRKALNAKDVAAAYNNLNQYRYLAEELLRAGWNDEVLRVANYFKYYAQTAYAMKLAFVTETAAFDLCTLNELAYDLEAGARDGLLRIFLDVDKEAEAPAQESSLRGVRKAQVKLATYYLQKGDRGLARRIYRDMRDEKPDRLASIRDELLAVATSEFWEINDRGGVFEYMDPERRALISAFFEWFPSISPPKSVSDEVTSFD